MTKWEIGQELIRISDFIGEIRDDLVNDGHRDISEKLKVIQASVGDLFDENNDHAFGILNSKDLK